ncbi:hypothetical protein ACSBL2_04630 [Pedobacter sp. AW31-3R]|uniref:hypothetical protein n=1 Tax=Pedobacter sp. AW31-3R TaxID=3445781 RepID=UPI003F9F207D
MTDKKSFAIIISICQLLCLWVSLGALLVAGLCSPALAQDRPAAERDKHTNKPLIHYLNDDRSHYIKFGGYAQVWARYTEMNPGSKIDESVIKNTSDFSLRRLRFKMSMVPMDKFLIVFQAGSTNVTNLSNNESSFDVLDAYGEYQFNPHVQIGAGRSSWKGLTRFAAGPTSTLLYDVPFLTLGNVNRTDLTLRSLNIYAKGQLGRLDYRLSIARPYIISPAAPQQHISSFNNLAVKPTLSGYVKWQFFEKESNTFSTSAGSYLGNKKVLALGIGAEYQKNALWHLNNQDTVLNSMRLFSADIFFDTPVDKKRGTAFNVYAAVFHHDYGPNYTRSLGINNMANGVDTKTASFNGSGNSYPIVGTGNSFILQTGYTLPYFSQQKKTTRLMPAAAFQYSKFDRLGDPMFTYDLGLTLLMKGHASKFVLNAQSRPVYTTVNNELKVSDRKMMYVLMYHVSID